LNPAAPCGVIRNILGMNNSPRINSAAREASEIALFKQINPGRTRYHDPAHENPGYALVNISQIFPLFHADENDPRNYNFKATDYYLSLAASCGTELEIRLGEDIEHSREHYKVLPPPDPEKWARICLNIIRHYNEGWADGMHLGIRYWCVWEEPDNPKLFDGPYEKYLELYSAVAKAIKKEFPALKVGGPNTMGGLPWSTEPFFQHCRDTGTPVDFAEFTTYLRDPEVFLNQCAVFEDIVRKYGFTDAELCVSEFHYGPLNWDMTLPGVIDTFTKAESAAYTTYLYTKLLDTSYSMAFYYSWACAMWGVTKNNFGKELLPVGHGLVYFAEMARCKARLMPEISNPSDSAVFLCGVTEEGTVKVMATFFKSNASDMTFNIPGKTICRMRRIEDISPDPEAVIEIDPNEDGSFTNYFDGGSAVIMYEFV
ncbi:MAG: hypothetical protein IKK25_04460, partial [Lentisphaeria bacterium]|nr:hypothetical protein [Lentisphaeria bacterium]